MHNLSVGALFKNEAHCIKEWVDHYLFHGVEHFYLINDSSTDNSVDILQEYINKGLVTLYNSTYGYYLGRQKDMYNEYILPHVKNKETKWLLMVDLDEFMWSPQSINLNDVLNICNNFAQIQVNHTLFGSNEYIDQPPSLVKYFTRRSSRPSPGNIKYFVHSLYDFESLNVHHATFTNKEDELNIDKFVILGPEYFVLNHYCCQSLQFWENIKCTRGDGDHYLIRTLNDFHKFDINTTEDFDLLNQNIGLL